MTEVLEVAGCLAAAGALSVSFLASEPRLRAAALVLAGVLAFALIAGQGWDELRTLRDHPPEFAAAILAGILVLAAGAAAMLRWPILLPVLLIAALPFRVRLHVAGGQEVNLLVPLYVAIGSGVLATLVETFRGRTTLRRLPKPLVTALVAVICLYALQTIYSPDKAFAARNIGFFLIPFAILFSLLAEANWDRRLLRLALVVLVAEGLILAAIGIGQFATQHIFWNDKLEASNNFHFYFRVNSLFWDPNIYGRYLVLTILLATTTLIWAANRALALVLAGAVAIAFAGLVFAFSQTSFIALFAGLVVLVALRWSFRWTAIATVGALVLIVAGLAVRSASNDSNSINTEGHGTLVSGGLKLARHRPLYGYGSASFSKEFAREEHVPPGRHDDLAQRAGHSRGGAGRDRGACLHRTAPRRRLDDDRRDEADGAGPGGALPPVRRREPARAGPAANRGRRRLRRPARPHDRLRGLPHRSAHLGAACDRRSARRRGGRR